MTASTNSRQSRADGVSTKVMTITPDLALDILTRPGKNRRISEKIVQQYVDAILRGAWQLNGEPIILDKNGSLIDGQHRLTAVVQAGKSIEGVLVEGVAEDSYETLDTGYAKKPSHYLTMIGERHSSGLAPALRYLRMWESGWDLTLQTRRMGNDQMRDLLSRHPGIRVSVGEMQRYTRFYPFRGRAPASCFSFCHYAATITGGDVAKADEFTAGVMRGVELTEGDPRYVLRQRFLVGEFQPGKTTFAFWIGHIVLAWNYWSQGRSCKILRPTGIPEFEGERELRQDEQIKAAQARLEVAREAVAADDDAGAINRRDAEIVEEIRASGDGGATASDLAEAFDLDLRLIQTLLARLSKLGLVVVGSRKSGKSGGTVTRYVVPEEKRRSAQ